MDGDVLSDSAFDGVAITDTVPPFRLDPDLVRSKPNILDTAGLFATAIERIYDGGSLTDLMEV